MTLDLSSLIPGIAVLSLCLSILLFHGLTGVPPVPSSSSEIADVIELLRNANLPMGAIIYELGSGWGSMAIALAHAFPDAEIRGIEISPVPYLFSKLRMRRFENVTIRWGNFFDQDISDADAVTCYLMIKPMQKIGSFLDKMLKDGTPVVSLTFWFRDRQVEASREGPGLRGGAALYSWPARKV
ncbi:SAM-dependent methyltransferase [Rhizobium jaguaris]|uniref:Class I SAM-dependent methyltransferase n=1 Tax=Rhizobium jaguaris TaxID=1312183 RepID=A0A387G3X7_9HYPH|nr:class I SAM-dependent methyltransferase [Rhizobium jaguaris]AYG62306.1 class I SAM-dependent methyltransferase [Rhizobium jaguaris]